MPSPLELKVQVGLSGIDLPLTTDDGDVTPSHPPSTPEDVWTLSDVQLIIGDAARYLFRPAHAE